MKLLFFHFIFLFSFLVLSEPSKKSYVSYDGPNCLNSALFENKITGFHQYTSNAEMMHILKSEACQILSANESLTMNDIGIIISNSKYAAKGVISHAFVITDGNRLFEKHGYSRSEAYQFSDIATVFSEYSVPESARVEYYRCQNFADTLQKNLSTDEVIRIYNQLTDIQTSLHSFIFQSNRNLLLPDLHSQIKALAEIALKAKLPEFLNMVIATRLVSISGQLNALGFSQMRTLVWQFELSLKNPLDVYQALIQLED